jgi:transcriptional regulator of acetoin/glycerol metabolism
LSDEAREALLGYPWPGNVRELKNVLERARLLCRDGMIDRSDLNLPARRIAPGSSHEPDREEIETALKAASGVVSRAAQALGLSRQALYRRMEKFGLAAPGV